MKTEMKCGLLFCLLLFSVFGCRSVDREGSLIVGRVRQVEKEEFRIRELGIHSVSPVPDDPYIWKDGMLVPLRLVPEVEARRKVLASIVETALRRYLREAMGTAFKEGARWMLYVVRLEWGRRSENSYWLELEACVRDYEGRTPIWRKVRREWRRRGTESEQFIYESLATEAARALADALPIAPPLPASLTDTASGVHEGSASP